MKRNGEMSCSNAAKVMEHVSLSPQHCLREEGGFPLKKNENKEENLNLRLMET